MTRPATAVILAAGHGSRMRSAMPKALHRIAGRSMLAHIIAACTPVFSRIVVVVGPDGDEVAQAAAPHAVVVQHDRRGTAHAAMQAAEHFGDGDVAVLYVDNPLLRPETLSALLARRANGDAALAFLAMRPRDPGRYGRVVEDAAGVARIVEYADADEAERRIGLCNAGAFCGAAADMRRWLGHIRNDNAKGEYYLTDIVAAARSEAARIAWVAVDEAEARGINSRAELALAEAEMQARLRVAAMERGVSLVHPDTVFLCADTELAADVTVGPNVVFGPGVRVAAGAEIRAFSHLEACSIGPGAIVGPFARLRPGAVLEAGAHVGNFVEVKAAVLGAGSKANHLSYIGDATVGPGTNIGAGTITCNYDGYFKHRTEIGSAVFIGSHTALVAPVRVADGAIVAAGSVITRDVPADSLAIARGRQEDKAGRAAEMRRVLAARKARCAKGT